jgi:hypothetical protein
MNAPTPPIAVLVQALRQAKLAEATATEHRQEIERQIVARYPAPAGNEGTVKEDEFSIAFKVTRSVDTEALQNAWATLGTNAEKAFKWKADLDLKQYRAIKDLDPVAYGKLNAFVITKPAKPALTLKVINEAA